MQLQAPPLDLMAQNNPTLAQAGRLTAMGKAGGLPDATRIRAAAQEFESIFLGQMLEPMFETVEPDPLTGGGSGERMFRSMLVQEYGRALSQAGGIGIADVVQRQILALQEIEP